LTLIGDFFGNFQCLDKKILISEDKCVVYPPTKALLKLHLGEPNIDKKKA
jgi:hypothetical protein